MRVLALLLVFVLSSCTGAPQIGATPRPTNTPDIDRAKLDLAYSALVDQDVHRVSSKKALEMGLEFVREEARKTGGEADVETPALEDVSEVRLADFRKFADALGEIAANNPQLSGDDIAIAAITGMMRATPDCHTYYFDGRRIDSRPVQETGVSNPAPPQGRVIYEPDEAGLTARIIEGGVAYIRFVEFRITGTYDIRAKMKTVLEQGLAAGAKAWIFDLRGNGGGNGAEVIASYFMNGEGVMTILFRNGPGGTSSAFKELRMPEQFQLPIAVILNDRGGSGPEVFALYLKEAKRATIVGSKSIGCLGATSPTRSPDGSIISVAVQEFGGAISGKIYNNVGIEPDIPASDAEAIEVARQHLLSEVAAR